MITTEAARELGAKERKHKEQLKRSLSSALAADLYRLLQEELEADVSLYASSGSVRAHRAVLLARAPHILQGQTHKEPIIIHLPGYELCGLKEFLRRVYTADHLDSSEISSEVNGSQQSPVTVADSPELLRSNDSDPGVLEPASGLGADLLAFYQRGEQCDITIQVAEQIFSCHRAILCARSQYFRAMLSGSWMESSRQCITLQGLGPDEMEILLQFMYGAIVDLPSGASASQVVLAADMLGLEGLKDVVEMVLTRDYCRFFPKPADGVQRTILECLSLTHALGLQHLHMLCMRWVAEHFVKAWCERNFSLLSPELHRACFASVTEAMNVQNAVTTLCSTEQLIGSLPEVKWAQQVRILATELQDHSLQVIIHHFPNIIRTQAFLNLRRREELTREPMLLKKLCLAIREGVTVDNCCDLFMAVDRLCGDDCDQDFFMVQQQHNQDEPFRQEICWLRGRLWTFLLQSFYAVRHTRGWETLSSRHREKILADAIDTGDSRRLAKKPVFSSSQARAVKCPSSAPENPRTQRASQSRTSSLRTTTPAMKSDGPGAANKPGEVSTPKAKNTKKSGEKSVAAKTKTAAAPVVNGTVAAAAARRDVASANGPRSTHGVKDQEKKPNPGARPKTSPPSCTSSGQTAGSRTPRSTVGKTEGANGTTGTQPSVTSTSGSASPENGANDTHSVPGVKPKPVKAVSKSTLTKPQRSDGLKTSSPTNKSSVRESGKAKTPSAGASARTDTKGKSTTDQHVLKQGSSKKKPSSPRKEDKEALKPLSSDKTSSESPKTKNTKPVTGVSAKIGTKPAKASSAPSKQTSSVTTKSAPKLKNATELSTEKTSLKVVGSPRTSAVFKKSETTVGETVIDKKSECKTGTTGNSGDGAENKEIPEEEPSKHFEGENMQPTSQSLGDSGNLESNPKDSVAPSGDGVGATDGKKVEKDDHPVTSTKVELCTEHEGIKSKSSQIGVIPAHITTGQTTDISSPNSPRDSERLIDTPCSVGSTGTPLEDSWSGIHHQVSPESETGSTHTTSSDDIKPRSEDYDAGGSQDDDCSNDRGVSKCGTMRCSDFLGRSSSDTSTPEELKMYEGGAGLRVEVRLRGKEPETTSEEEVARRRPRSWLHREDVSVQEAHSVIDATVTVKNVPDNQIFSSEEEEEDEDEEETEDEKSEVEVIPGQAPLPPSEPSPHFQGIINLAFDDDGADQDNDQPDYQSTSNFRRSVLLSVDECEELGSEEGGVQTPPQQTDDNLTPCDVFECDSTAASIEQQNHLQKHPRDTTEELQKEKSVFLTEIHNPSHEEKNCIEPDAKTRGCSPLESDTRDGPPQERPCHLDLRHTEQYNGGMSKNHQSESKKAELHLDLNEPQLSGYSSVHAPQSPAGNV